MAFSVVPLNNVRNSMPNNSTQSDIFEAKSDGIPAFGDEETENSEESATSETTEEGTESEEETTEGQSEAEGETEPESSSQEDGTNTPDEEENVPFHKHPRFKQLIEEKKQLEERLNQVEQTATPPKQEEEASPEMPKWWKRAFGEDEDAQEAYEMYLQETKQEREKLREEVRTELKQEEQQAKEKEKQYEKWVDDSLEELKQEGLKFDRNELMKVAMEYKPTDEDGNLSLRKAYDIWNIQKQQSRVKNTDKKKQVAQQAAGTDKGEDKSEKPASWNDIRRQRWGSITLDS